MSSIIRKKFICKICDREYSSAGCLKIHLHQVHGDSRGKSFCCEFCEKTFTIKGNKQRHVKAKHIPGAPKYMCDVCGIECDYQWDLERHKDRKHREQKFKCVKCGKLFTLKSCMKRHTLTCKVDTRDFSCALCNARFKSKRYVNSHVKFVHGTGKREHVFDVCGEVFTRPYVLKRQMKRRHQNK